MAALIAFVFCFFLYPFYIKWLVARQIGQFIRQEGPASHAAKSRTPTMGGLCFIGGTVIAALCVTTLGKSAVQPGYFDTGVIFVLSASALCGLLGFADDFGKITKKSNAGISGKLRLACEFGLGLALGFGFQFYHAPEIVTGSFSGSQYLLKTIHLSNYPALDFLYRFLLVPFIMAATSNALNLHDGMDGLAAGTSILVFISLSAMLICLPGCAALGWTAAAAAGALTAFLLYNRYPARIFMGDTGSLFIGALMAALVSLSGLVLWFIPLALIYIVETLSVISQVLYFKLTKPYEPERPMSPPALVLFKLSHTLPGQGKRLWRMAPIHHHFEALAAEKNHKEWQVVLCFWLAQLIISSICLAAFRFAV